MAVAAGLGVGDKEGQDDEGEGGLETGGRSWAGKGGAAAAEEVGKWEVEVIAAGVGVRELEEAAVVWGG